MPPKGESKKRYKALVGLSYPDPKRPGEVRRVQAGDIVEDIPSRSMPWLLEQKLVREVR